MKRIVPIATLLTLLLPALAHADGADGKSIFTAQKCNTCHEISTQGVKALPPDPADADDGPIKIRDLAGVGKDVDAAFLQDFLQKKVNARDGKKHPRRFKGTDAELQTLTTWLAGQKADVSLDPKDPPK